MPVLKARDRRLVYLDRRRDLDLLDVRLLSRLATGAPQPGEQGTRNLLGLHARSSIRPARDGLGGWRDPGSYAVPIFV